MKPNTRIFISIVSSVCMLTTLYAADTTVVNDTTIIQKLNNLWLSSSDPYASNLECNSDVNTYNTNYPKWKRTKCLYNWSSYLYYLYTSENESKVNEILNISNWFIGNTSTASRASSSVRTSEFVSVDINTNSEDDVSDLFDSIQLEEDSWDTLIQKLKEKMWASNVQKSDIFIQKVKNLKDKKNTDWTNKYTTKTFIELIDKLISQLDTLRSKANTNFEKWSISKIKLDRLQSIIQYIKIWITKIKTETQDIEGDDDFWSELWGDEDDGSDDKGIKIESKTDAIIPDNHARTINFLGWWDANSCKEDAKGVFGSNVTKYTCKIWWWCCLNWNVPWTNWCVSANPNMYWICWRWWDDVRVACWKAKDWNNKNYSNVYDLLNQQAEFVKYWYCWKGNNKDVNIGQINWTCGSVNWQTVSNKPTYNLCKTWEAGGFEFGWNTWYWVCKWIEWWSNESCKVNIRSNGAINWTCWSAHKNVFKWEPADNLCLSWEASEKKRDWNSAYAWQCKWINWWSSTSCHSLVYNSYVNLINWNWLESCNKTVFDNYWYQKYNCTIWWWCCLNWTPPWTDWCKSANPSYPWICIKLWDWHKTDNSDIKGFSHNSQQYQVMPGWCWDNTDNPSCNWVDSLIKDWASAKQYCDNMIYGWFSDWFLPSKDELGAMYNKRSDIWGFIIKGYWSSTENYGQNTARMQFFPEGGQTDYHKFFTFHVRCIRKM